MGWAELGGCWEGDGGSGWAELGGMLGCSGATKLGVVVEERGCLHGVAQGLSCRQLVLWACVEE